MTRPRKGNDWKRDAKAGFTGVILLGRVCLSEQIVTSESLVNKANDTSDEAKRNDPRRSVNQLNAEPRPNWKPQQHEPVWKWPSRNQCATSLWCKPAAQGRRNSATTRLRVKLKCITVNLPGRTLATDHQIMEGKTRLVGSHPGVNSKHGMSSGLTKSSVTGRG